MTIMKDDLGSGHFVRTTAAVFTSTDIAVVRAHLLTRRATAILLVLLLQIRASRFPSECKFQKFIPVYVVLYSTVIRSSINQVLVKSFAIIQNYH